MDRNNKLSRRRYVKAAGATGIIGLVAGCADTGGNGAENGDENETENGDENGAENGDENETENGDEDGGAAEGVEIEPGTDIELNAITAGWEGISPSEIEGEENPTLALTEGEDYTIGWPNESDGASHNIEIRDENDEVVDDLSTEIVDEPSEDQVLEFTVSEEMAQYVCQPHETTMRGDFEIVTDGAGGNGEEEDAENETDEADGNETDDNETEENGDEENETDE